MNIDNLNFLYTFLPAIIGLISSLIVWKIYITEGKHKKKKFKKKHIVNLNFILIFIPAVLGIVLSIIAWNIYKVNRDSSTNDGEIKQTKTIKYNETIDIHAGISIFVSPIELFKDGKEVDLNEGFPGTPLNLKLKLKDNRLLVSTNIISSDGNFVGELVENEWRLNPNNMFTRNFDDNGLEIIDNNNIPVFQIDMIDNNNIRIGGIIRSGNKIAIVKNNDEPYRLIRRDSFDIDQIKEYGSEVKKMFKYPISKHLKKRNMVDPKNDLEFKLNGFTIGDIQEKDKIIGEFLYLNVNAINKSKHKLKIKKIEADLHFGIK